MFPIFLFSIFVFARCCYCFSFLISFMSYTYRVCGLFISFARTLTGLESRQKSSYSFAFVYAVFGNERASVVVSLFIRKEPTPMTASFRVLQNIWFLFVVKGYQLNVAFSTVAYLLS